MVLVGISTKRSSVTEIKLRQGGRKMGRHKKIPVAPDSIGEYVKHNTDWKLMVQNLTRLAIGGDTIADGNALVAQTNLEALRLLFLFAWGQELQTTEAAGLESVSRVDSGGVV